MSAEGPAAIGEAVLDEPKAGRIYFLSFPSLYNKSSEPIHILGFQMHAPTTIKVLDYRAYTPSQFGGRVIIEFDPANPETSFSFDAVRPLATRYTIAPKTRSDRYAMARVRLVRLQPGTHTRDCQVDYTQGTSGQRYAQVLPCLYQFGNPN